MTLESLQRATDQARRQGTYVTLTPRHLAELLRRVREQEQKQRRRVA